MTVEIGDHAQYLFTCKAGHKVVHHLMNPKFEILFEMGFLAFADGYTREAVSTFASAFEEFLRVFITTALVKDERGRYPIEELALLWKVMNRAEPQLGAFAVLYMIETGKAPGYPTQKSVKFRNDVIHRGKIPKAAKVVEWAQDMLSFVIPLYAKYRFTEAMVFATLFDFPKPVDAAIKELTQGAQYATAIGQLLTEGSASFERAVQTAATNRFLVLARNVDADT